MEENNCHQVNFITDFIHSKERRCEVFPGCRLGPEVSLPRLWTLVYHRLSLTSVVATIICEQFGLTGFRA